jgi:histidyl-tRNA synthetase
MEIKYKIENPRIEVQLKYAETLLNRQFTNTERHLFEWAYIQGKEDYKEGYVK